MSQASPQATKRIAETEKAELSLVLYRRRVGHMDRAANDAKAGIRTDGLEFGG
jgi:hypothetical protein